VHRIRQRAKQAFYSELIPDLSEPENSIRAFSTSHRLCRGNHPLEAFFFPEPQAAQFVLCTHIDGCCVSADHAVYLRKRTNKTQAYKINHPVLLTRPLLTRVEPRWKSFLAYKRSFEKKNHPNSKWDCAPPQSSSRTQTNPPDRRKSKTMRTHTQISTIPTPSRRSIAPIPYASAYPPFQREVPRDRLGRDLKITGGLLNESILQKTNA